MGTYDYDIGIIGGGAAGLTVASGAAQLGAKTLLVEKDPHLGGDCLHYGCVPSKTLIRTAQAFCRLGTKVTVVQRSGHILSKKDKDMADEVMTVLTSEGVTFHLDTFVLGVKALGTEREVIIKDQEGETKSLRAEKILVAVGRDPNVKGLKLEEIGVQFDRKGIKVDDRMRTSQKHIYAAGDVIGAFQFTHAAGDERGIVVSNAIFHLPRKVDYTFLPCCTYTDPELASIGMNEKSAKAAGIDYSFFSEAFKDNDRSLAEGERVGRIKMILDKSEKPIGVQILGPQAGELLSEWVRKGPGRCQDSTDRDRLFEFFSIER